MTAEIFGATGLFGSYDIRGRFPEDFPPAVRARIADAFLQTTRQPFVVARDARRASAELERAVAARIESRSLPVLRLGIQPTPVVGFASALLSATGLAFTPSHNALGYAGIKAFGPTGRSLGSKWSRVRRAFARPQDLPQSAGLRPDGGKEGSPSPVTAIAVRRAYLAHVTRGLETRRSIVIDGRGGATTRLAPRALSEAGARVRELHPRFSPGFHRLSPEPLPENVGDLGRAVRAAGADLGVAFDGDGDRVAFVDERGEWVEPEVVGTFLHRTLSTAERPLVASVDASQRCEAKTRTVRSRVGGRYITAAMRRHRSTVGFEASSHYYLSHWGPNSDGILTACVVSHLLDRERTSLRRLGREFGPIVRERQLVHFRTRTEALGRYRELTGTHSDRLEKGIDGVVFRVAEGSVLMRLSNTQPTIRIVLEPNPGRSLATLRGKWEQVAGELRAETGAA